MSDSPEHRWDVVVGGGGPAGLSSALVLARCRRRVAVVDAGIPRNACSDALHGFLTRDGTRPSELLEMGREEIRGYGVRLQSDTVGAIAVDPAGFRLDLRSGEMLHSRKVLLATGVIDRIPKIPQIERYYGKSVHHCPYCDGWEHREGGIAVYGHGRGGAVLALKMKVWSADVILCADGAARMPETDRERLARQYAIIAAAHGARAAMAIHEDLQSEDFR